MIVPGPQITSLASTAALAPVALTKGYSIVIQPRGENVGGHRVVMTHGGAVVAEFTITHSSVHRVERGFDGICIRDDFSVVHTAADTFNCYIGTERGDDLASSFPMDGASNPYMGSQSYCASLLETLPPVNVLVTATKLCAATRGKVTIQNLGPNAIYVGDSGVTAANGQWLPDSGASMEVSAVNAVYAICPGGNQTGNANTRLLSSS